VACTWGKKKLRKLWNSSRFRSPWEPVYVLLDQILADPWYFGAGPQKRRNTMHTMKEFVM
jgi:hypothetical protein